MTYDACPSSTLCRLLATSARVWLVRPDALEVTAALGILLLHYLPGFLVALSAEIAGHG